MNQHKSSCQANPKPNVSVWEMQPDSFLGEVGLQQTSPWISVLRLSRAARGFGILRLRMCEQSEKLMAGISSCPSIKQLHLPVPHQAPSEGCGSEGTFLSSRNSQEGRAWPSLWHWGQHCSSSVPSCSVPTLVSQPGMVARTGLYQPPREVRAAQQLPGLF